MARSKTGKANKENNGKNKEKLRDRKQAIKAEKAAAKKQKKAAAKAERTAFAENLLHNGITLKDRYDFPLLVMILIMSIFGMAMVFSAGYYSTINSTDPDPFYYLKRQGFYIVSGWVLMMIFANFNYHNYRKISNAIIGVSIGLLILVLLVGINTGGATRWLGYGSLRITPSEISKLAVIIFTSVYVSENPEAVKTSKGLGVLVLILAVHFALIVKQPNLSTAIVIAAIIVALMMVAGMNLILLVVPVLLGVAGYFYIMTFQKDSHWYVRLTSFLDPFADSQGDGYQVSQGLIALGNGGLKGLGFGKSMTKNLYLPEPQNDFILAVIGEELGYIGFLVLMAAYMFMLFRLIKIALEAKDSLGFYLATGVAVMLGLQVIINVAVVTASMPATGITLPFISYGGTSMWSFMAAMGIALNVSRSGTAARKAKRKKQKITAAAETAEALS